MDLSKKKEFMEKEKMSSYTERLKSEAITIEILFRK